MTRNLSKKLMKIFAIIVLVISVLAGGAIAFLVTTIDQDTIKSKAIQLVRDKTNRELKINGEVSWTFFPWLGLKIQNISLSNPPDFKDSYFAEASEIDVNIKLLPLILGNIEIGHLNLKNFNLQLLKNNLDKSNWQDLLALGDATPITTTQNRKPTIENFIISDIAVDNGSILWQDQKTNKKIKISKLNLHCRNIDLNQPFDLSTSFHLDNLISSLNSEVTANTQVKLDIKNGLYEFKRLQLASKLKNKTATATFDLEGKVDIKLDLKKQLLLASALKLNIAKTSITGSLQGSNIIDNPTFSGNLTLNNTDAAELMTLLEINKYFKKGTTSSFKTTLSISANIVNFKTIEAHLNDTILQGNANYAITSNNTTFDLALNKLDYAVFADKPTKTPPATAPTTEPELIPRLTSKQTKSITTNDHSTKLNGHLKIGAIKYGKLQFTNFSTKIAANNGIIDCQKIGFDFYQGKAFGSANINTRSTTPNINLKLTLDNTSIQTMLKDLANYENFSGSLTLNTNITISNLTGNGSILINHGSYRGVGVPYEVRRAHAVLNIKQLPEKPQSPHTDFDKLTMNFRVNNGILSTNDFLVQAPDYKITGQGSANLKAKNLDLSLSAYSTHDENFFVPIKVTGALTDPSIRFDAVVMLQHAIKKVVNNVIQNQVEKHIKNLPQEINKILPLNKLFN